MAGWEKLENESDRYYSYFLAYLKHSPPRTAAMMVEELGYSHTRIQHLIADFHWKDRARAYDQEQTRLYMEKMVEGAEEAQRKVIDDALEDYDRLVKLWRERVSKIEKEETKLTDDGFVKLSAARKTIDDLGRRSSGLPNTIQPIQLPKEETKTPQKKLLAWNTIVGSDET